jgi:hypothetical protein
MRYKILFPVLLFLSVCVALCFTAYPAIGWWDSGHYALAAQFFSIPGAGGSLLFLLLGRLFSILFFFLPDIRAINLVSIVATSTTAVFFYLLLLRLFRFAKIVTSQFLSRAVAFSTALSLPFLFSIWSEAGVSRVYGLGLLLTAMMLYFTIIIWSSEDEGLKFRLFLMNIYLLGLDFASHRLGAPLIVIFLLTLIWPLRRQLLNPRFWLAAVSLIIVSFSLHLYLLIRSNMELPAPLDTIGNLQQLLSWVKMERFGDSPLAMLFHRRGSFWQYQLNEMYLRYFGWNFLESHPQTVVWITPLFGWIPLILGSLGIIYGMIKKVRLWWLLSLLYVVFSIVLVFYLNVEQGFRNVREIDRLFLPSFFIFHLFIGVGLAAVIEGVWRFFSKQMARITFVPAFLFILALMLLPLNLFISNYKLCNKSHYDFPVDFAYNLLTNCEPNAILFTNGDNDTFPLWYLQYVEGFRKDVSVVNIPLLNTHFYLAHIQNHPNPVTVNEKLLEAEHLGVMRIDRPVTFTLPLPRYPDDTSVTTDSLSIQFEGFEYNGIRMLRVQDQAMISILHDNSQERPVYFSSTVYPGNRIGLDSYLGLCGAAFKFTGHAQQSLLTKELRENLVEKYRYRHFDDPNVSIEESVVSLYDNFRNAFIRLAEYYLSNKEFEKARSVFQTMQEKLPAWRFPSDSNTQIDEFQQRLNEQLIDVK